MIIFCLTLKLVEHNCSFFYDNLLFLKGEKSKCERYRKNRVQKMGFESRF